MYKLYVLYHHEKVSTIHTVHIHWWDSVETQHLVKYIHQRATSCTCDKFNKTLEINHEMYENQS